MEDDVKRSLEDLIDQRADAQEQREAAAVEAEVAEPVSEETASAPMRLPTPRCGFCQSFLFVEGKSGVNTFNIQMGDERVRIFTCAVCESVLPIQVMMIATPMIAAPGAQGGRLIKH